MNCLNCGFYPCGCPGGLGAAGYATQTVYTQPGMAQACYVQPVQPVYGQTNYVDTATYTSPPVMTTATTTTYTTGSPYGAAIGGGIGYGVCPTCQNVAGACLCPRIY